MTMSRKLLCLALAVFLALPLAPGAAAQETYRWQVNYQHVVLDIDPSGVVYMTYEVDADIVLGTWTEVWIPVTASNMQVTGVVDGNGNSHEFSIDGDQIKTRGWSLQPGDHVYLRINSQLPGFVYAADKADYAIVEFIPPWWDMAITDTQVKYVLPGNVPTGEVYTGAKLYDNAGVEDNRTWVYFEDRSLSANEQFDTAVSFPDSYMAAGAVSDSGGSSLDTGIAGLVEPLLSCTCPAIFLLFVFIVIVGGVGGSLLRKPYESPVVSMDGVGVNKNLDAAEAATLLRVDPKRVLTMIMFGLMKKGNVKLLGTDPIRLGPVSREGANYYEKLYMDAIVDDRLDEDRLLACFRVLARRVVDKTRPYCRKDTEDYYRARIDEAWAEIKAVDTPELKLSKYDDRMFWLMADEQFARKTKEYVADVPGSRTVRVPDYYWWYPYYFGLPHYWGTGRQDPGARPAGTAGTGAGTGKAQAPSNATTTSVESFANSFSNSVEATAAGVVVGVEKFLGVRNEANAPAAPAASSAKAPAASHRYSGGGGSCACVSCACACVSCACACACAGGGGGCT